VYCARVFVTLDPRILSLLGWVYGFIAACSVFALVHPRLRGPGGVKVRHAILSWWPVSLVGGTAVALGPWAAVPILAAVSAATLREFLAILPAADRHPTLDALTYAAVPLHYAALVSRVPALAYGGIVAWGALVLPLARMFLCGPQGFLAASARLLFGLVLTVLGLGHVALLFLFQRPLGPAGPEGFGAVFLLLVMTSDAGQYLAGKLFGRRPIAPVISPKKTLEGLLGGLAITAGVGALAAPRVTPFGSAWGAAVGAGFTLAGLLGDLLVSAIKRDAGVKDTGAVLPGQGGVLDRCDSMLLAGPLYAVLLSTVWLA
jgi:phosphatidate cytidylyltransferase